MSIIKNKIFPGETEFSRKIAIAGIIVFVVLAGVYIITRRRQAAPPLTPPPVTGDVSIQAGFFTVSYSPSTITLKKGDVKPMSATIKVIPLEGFSESVLFAIDGIWKDGELLADSKMLKASFKPKTLEGKDFEKGTVLTVRSSATIAQGMYFISYRAQSSKVKKDFIAPVNVE